MGGHVAGVGANIALQRVHEVGILTASGGGGCREATLYPNLPAHRFRPPPPRGENRQCGGGQAALARWSGRRGPWAAPAIAARSWENDWRVPAEGRGPAKAKVRPPRGRQCHWRAGRGRGGPRSRWRSCGEKLPSAPRRLCRAWKGLAVNRSAARGEQLRRTRRGIFRLGRRNTEVWCCGHVFHVGASVASGQRPGHLPLFFSHPHNAAQNERNFYKSPTLRKNGVPSRFLYNMAINNVRYRKVATKEEDDADTVRWCSSMLDIPPHHDAVGSSLKLSIAMMSFPQEAKKKAREELIKKITIKIQACPLFLEVPAQN